jgi:hypothetical protein
MRCLDIHGISRIRPIGPISQIHDRIRWQNFCWQADLLEFMGHKARAKRNPGLTQRAGRPG